MEPDPLFKAALVLLAAYMSMNVLFSQEFSRLQRRGVRRLVHGIGCGIVAVAGAAALLVLEPEFYLGAIYLLMPLVYLLLLQAASALSRKLHARPLIGAHRYNMKAAETREARFTDYALFFVVHVPPLVIPPLVVETFLGLPV